MPRLKQVPLLPRLPRLCGVRVLLALVLFGFAGAAMAWNAAGHRLTAAIAWRLLDDTVRAQAGQLLAHHPDYSQWVQSAVAASPDERAYAAFLAAATWPDDIKGDPRFFDADGDATPLLPGFPDMARHRDWHYVDYPLSWTGPLSGAAQIESLNRAGFGRNAGQGRLVQQLALRLRIPEINPQKPPVSPGAATGQAEYSAPLAHAAYAFSWQLHLVADAHQPLHTVSRYTADGQHDRGGNDLLLETPGHPRHTQMSLHAYWDDLPGPPWLRGAALERAVDRLLHAPWPPQALAIPPAYPAAFAEYLPEAPALWLAESVYLGHTQVYEGIAGDSPILRQDYHERAQRMARERIRQAGYRLARHVQQIFATQKANRSGRAE